MSADRLGALVRAVQTNCHIADAGHARDLSLCIYLLQMREMFRWEQGLAFTEDLDRQALGQWLARREALWAGLEDRPCVPLPIGARRFDAHDVQAVNVELAPLGLVYGAGLAASDRPTYVLAALDRLQQRGERLTLQVCGREHARGLFAPPAALVGEHTIMLRRESLGRWLWEKFEAFSLRRAEGPMRALADAYALHDRCDFAAALPRLVDDLGESLVLHEVGEYRAGQWLGPEWAAMRLALGQRATDLRVRAVRDHIADLEVTLPTLVEGGQGAALHFWFASYEGLREQLFPTLAQGYAAWRDGDAGRALLHAARDGAVHFRALAAQVLGLHRRLGRQAGPAIERLLSSAEAVCTLPGR